MLRRGIREISGFTNFCSFVHRYQHPQAFAFSFIQTRSFSTSGSSRRHTNPRSGFVTPKNLPLETDPFDDFETENKIDGQMHEIFEDYETDVSPQNFRDEIDVNENLMNGSEESTTSLFDSISSDYPIQQPSNTTERLPISKRYQRPHNSQSRPINAISSPFMERIMKTYNNVNGENKTTSSHQEKEEKAKTPAFTFIKQDLSQDPKFTRLPDWAKNELHNYTVSLEGKKEPQIEVPNSEWSQLLSTSSVRICMEDIPYGTDTEGIMEMIQTIHSDISISNIEVYTKKVRKNHIFYAMADIELPDSFEQEKKRDFFYNLFTFGVHIRGSRHQIFPCAFMKEIIIHGIPKGVGESELKDIILNEWGISPFELDYPKPDVSLHKPNPKSYLGRARLTFDDHENAARAFNIIKQSTVQDQRIYVSWCKPQNLVPFPEHSQLERLEKAQPQTDIIGALQQKNKELKKEVDALKVPKETQPQRTKDFFESSNYFRPKTVTILKREYDFKLKEAIFQTMKKYRENKKRTSRELGITLQSLQKHLNEMQTMPEFSSEKTKS